MQQIASIIPLAGPDFVHPTLGIKPLFSVDGEPLLRRAILSRPWWKCGALQSSRLIFVLRDLPESVQVLDRISEWFPGAQKVILSNLTTGALTSALAGVSLIQDYKIPICIDLVDIFYNAPELLLDSFEDEAVGGIVPYFSSQESCYSYFQINEQGLVTQAREKQVISSHASAGTYFFRDAATYLDAVRFSLLHRDDLSVKGNLFICPAMNAIISNDRKVVSVEVTNVKPVSKFFHA